MARTFNGSTEMFNSPAVFTGVSSWSMACWFRCTSLANAYTGILGFGTTNGQNFESIFIKSSGQMAYYVGAVSGTDEGHLDPGLSTPGTGGWHHVAMVWVSDSTTELTFVDGVSDGTFSGITHVGGTTNTFRIGNDLFFTPRNFSGQIADAAYWTTALSASQIAALARGASPSLFAPANLLAWLPFDEPNGPPIDRSMFRNVYTPTGNPYPSADHPPAIRKKFWPGIDALGWMPPSTGKTLMGQIWM
jgi:hypothetical protein